MSFNLMDLVKDQLSEQVMGHLGGVLGGSAEQNNSAISSAVPGLLSGLLNTGSSDSGANSILSAINGQDEGILDNLGDLLGGSQQSSMMDAGSNILGSLLGGSGLGSLVSAIAGFSGVGKGSAKSILGLLAPIIFSVIKRKLLSGGGLNVGGLMDMLTGQKDNIGAAMPAGFEQQLNASGFLNNIGSNVADATDSVTSAAGDAVSKGSSMFGRLMPIALIIAGLIFAYSLFSGKSDEPTVSAPEIAMQETIDIGGEVSNALSSVSNSLTSITDVESAKAAIPQLSGATEKLAGVTGMLDKLPDAAKGPIMTLVSDTLPQLHSLIDKVSAIPGVGPVIQPVVNDLLLKLSKFQ